MEFKQKTQDQINGHNDKKRSLEITKYELQHNMAHT